MRIPFTLCLGFGFAIAMASPECANAKNEESAYSACEGAPTQNDIDAAKGAYRAGQVSFEEAEYERAILYWEDAYRRHCSAVKLLLSLARAYELSEDRESAVHALQTYLDRRPEAHDRASVEKRIIKLKEMIAKEESQKVVAIKAKEKNTQAEETTPAEPVPAPKVQKPWWPIAMVGGGVALATVGHIVLGHGKRTAEKLGCDMETDICPDSESSKEASDARKKAQAIGLPLAITGHVVGAVGGVLWYYLWTRGPATAETSGSPFAPSIEPILTPTYQGLSFQTAF